MLRGARIGTANFDVSWKNLLIPSIEMPTIRKSPFDCAVYSMLKLSNVWTLLVILLWTGRSVLGQSQTVSTVVGNLRTYGWDSLDRHGHIIPSIAVDNEGRVLVGFTVRRRSGLVTRDQPSLDFRIMRFSPDGKVDLPLSLPTSVKTTNGIYLSDTDHIIARANDSIQLLQPDDGNPQKGTWKTLCAQHCGVLQSPTRHTLVLRVREADPPSMIIRFSPQPVLQPCGKGPQIVESDDGKIQNYARAITDEFAYFYQPDPQGFAYRWPLCNYDHRIELPVHGPYRVLNDKLFLVQTSTSHIGITDRAPEVISWDGQLKFQPRISKYESCVGDDLKAIRSDAAGDRIAVLLVTRRGGNLRLDISSHVTAIRLAVYDIEAGKEIASIPLKAEVRYGLDFDLSPDGRSLAILGDDTVAVVNLEQINQGDKTIH
jgi:hypothetical protein